MLITVIKHIFSSQCVHCRKAILVVNDPPPRPSGTMWKLALEVDLNEPPFIEKNSELWRSYIHSRRILLCILLVTRPPEARQNWSIHSLGYRKSCNTSKNQENLLTFYDGHCRVENKNFAEIAGKLECGKCGGGSGNRQRTQSAWVLWIIHKFHTFSMISYVLWIERCLSLAKMFILCTA